MLTIKGATHKGKREHNEDCFLVDAQLGFGLVADGMGGYACGEVASELVKQTVYKTVSENNDLIDGINRAHHLVSEQANSDSSKKGMGSTVIAVTFSGADYQLAWVGDSRAYLWLSDEGELRQISRDHSYVEMLIGSGAISEDDALNHPDRNIITQAVGSAGDDGIEIDFVEGRLIRGHRLILCSDGLVDELLDVEIAQLVATADTASDTVNSLIEAAVNAGGRDNITVVLIAAGDDFPKHLSAVIPESVRSTWLDMTAYSHTGNPVSKTAGVSLITWIVHRFKAIKYAITQRISGK